MGDRLRPTWDFDDLDASQHALPRTARRGADRRRPRRGAHAARARRRAGRPFRRGRPLLDEAERSGRLGLRSSASASISNAGDSAARAATPRRHCRCSRPPSPLRSRSRTSSSPSTPRTWSPSRLRTSRPGWPGRTEASSSPGLRPIPRSTTWLGSLFNNVGWDHFDAGEYETALGLVRACTHRAREAAGRARSASSMPARQWRRLAASSSPRRRTSVNADAAVSLLRRLVEIESPTGSAGVARGRRGDGGRAARTRSRGDRARGRPRTRRSAGRGPSTRRHRPLRHGLARRHARDDAVREPRATLHAARASMT